MMKPILLAATLTTAITLTACGTSDEDQIKDTVRTYLTAASAGDGELACKQLAAPSASCESQIETNKTIGDADVLRTLEVDDVVIDGGSAYATLRPSGEVPLKKADGEWGITMQPLDW